MKKYPWMIVACLITALFLTACGSDSKKDDDPEVPDNGAVTKPGAEAEKDETTLNTDSLFLFTTPKGLRVNGTYIVNGVKAVVLACDPVNNAVSYTFQPSFGQEFTSAAPKASYMYNGGTFTLSVYATNAKGQKTKTASASLTAP